MNATTSEMTGAGPFTDEEIISDARRIFELQRKHRWEMARTTPAERVARLERLRKAVLQHRDELARAVHEDFRKHASEFDFTEIQPLLIELRHTMKHLAEWLAPRPVETPLVLAGTRSEVRYEPRGVVLILGPWNYPFNLVIAPLVSAIAAGNTAILRPSEKTPRVAEVVGRMIRSTFDEREVAIVGGGVSVAEALLDLPFDHFFFTGSTRIGKKVMVKAAEHLASVTLELGGKSPVIVDASADLKATAERVVWGKFINAGQTCIAPDFTLVHASVHDDFIRELRAAIERTYGPTEEARRSSPDLPRVITREASRRLGELLDQTVKQGARVELGGAYDVEERYVAPTVLTGITPSSPIMREEIFGPILPVLTWRTMDELLERVRTGDKPLALYVFARNEDFVEELLRSTTAGATVVNNVAVHFGNANLPFGGIGASGVGNYHGEYGVRTFSHERAVMRQGRPMLLKHLYPPYGAKTRRLLAWVERISG
ncbi:MAG: aldehyde dehydrogenase family protein [Myxococcaceae bacterium]